MPDEPFQYTTVTRMLSEDVALTEALGFPEVSALGASEPAALSCLREKARSLLRDLELAPAISLHRRRLAATASLETVELLFEPPRRVPEWETPVTVRVHYVCWEDGDLFHAVVPGLGVHVFATRANLLPDRVEAHVRLVMASRSRTLNLRRLVALARVQSVHLAPDEVSVVRKTPKQLALAGSAREAPSILRSLADPWTPVPEVHVAEEGSENPVVGEAATTLPTAHGLESELRQLADALAGPHPRSVLLVGPAGSGKTALVRELARRRRHFGFGHTPFWSTSGARLMTGPSGFGMWQERCQQLCREIGKAGAILHLNHLVELIEVGRASRSDASVGSFLRPWVARGDILVIAECTPEQLAAVERRDPHLVGAFQTLAVAERTSEQTRAILDAVFGEMPGKPLPESGATRAALDRLHLLHQRYAAYSGNPGRALRFMKNLLADVFPEKVLTEAAVLAAFSKETGLPAVLIDDEVPLDLEQTAGWFGERVIGQSEAVRRVVDLLALVKARLARPRKPLASFLFIGPTGTGKTEMAKALARFLFGDPARMIRFDLNEYGDPVSVQRLIGGPAAGEAEGLLTARVREQPFSVVLLDEFEKADPAFFDLLLQVLGDGRLTDASGRVADFSNSVLVMTSNLGAQGFQRGPAGFREEGAAAPEAGEHFSDAVRKFLRPEIYNRLDAIVPFQPLSRAIVLAIAQRHLDLMRQRDGLRLRPVTWRVDARVAEHLARRGYDPRYGARPLKRVIERDLLVPLAEAIIPYAEAMPLTITLRAAAGRLSLQVRAEDTPLSESGALGRNLAEAVVAQRRRLGKLQRSAATRGLEDEVTVLEALERRLKATRIRSPEQAQRLAQLAALRGCLEAITALVSRSHELETVALSTLYLREPPDAALFELERGAIEREQQRLTREVFRRQHEQPDDVVVAFYSEHAVALLDLAGAYFRVIGRLGAVMSLDYFHPPPGGRSATTRLVRATAKSPAKFFEEPPRKVLGIALHARGDLFFPRFGPETGLHVIKEKESSPVCLVVSGLPPLDRVEPPPGIERPGAIKAQGASICRQYDRQTQIVTDAALGDVPWGGAGFDNCVERLTDQRLDRAMDAATR